MNAILIICHKNWPQTERLIRKVQSPETDVFVHVDSKYADWTMPEPQKGIYFTRRRLSGVLDDRSLVDIALELVNRAKEVELDEGKHYAYYLLLSGQDYPIKLISYINQQLREQYPTPFIDCTACAKGNWVYYKYHTRKAVLQMYQKMGQIKTPMVRTIYHGIAFLFRKTVSLLGLSDYDYFRKQGVSLYAGSAWWALPDQVIDYALEYAKTPYGDRLMYSTTPEETWFQTVTMQTPLANLVILNTPEKLSPNGKTWAYFYDETRRSPDGHPFVFTIDQYDRLIQDDRWFARKFDTDVDSKILDLLDDYLEKAVTE